MVDSLPVRRGILVSVVLGAFLSLLSGRMAPAQVLQTRKLPEAEAQKLRAEADRNFESQKYSEALSTYLKVYANYQHTFEINQRIAWLYVNTQKGRQQDAIPYLRAAHRFNPADVVILHDLAGLTASAQLFKESIPLYQELLRLAPQTPEYSLEFARTLSSAGQDAEAVKYYNMFLGHRPSDMNARIEFGRLLSRQKDFSGAMGQYNYVLRFQPNNVVARLRLAQVHAWTGQLQQSLEEVEEIIKTNPKYIDAQVVKAFDLLWLGERDRAKMLFAQLAKQDPTNPDVREGLKALEKPQQEAKAVVTPTEVVTQSDLQLAAKSEAEGHYSEAVAHYREFLAKFPDDTQAQFRIARVLGWNRQFAESESMLRDWVERNPKDPLGYFQLGRVLGWEEKFEEAAEQYRRGLELSPRDTNAHVEFARVLSWSKESPRALDEYRIALSLQPDNADAQRGVVQMLIRNGELDAARKGLAEMRQKHPDDAEVEPLQQQLEAFEARRARAQATFGPEVEKRFRATVEKDPKNIEARLLLADVYLERKDLPAAIKELRAASDLRPEDNPLRLRLARVLSWDRDYVDAETLYREYLRRNPDDEDAHLAMARVLSWGGNFDASVSEYQEILKRNPANTDARLGMARVLTWAKRYEEAVQEYDTLLHQDPKNFDALLGKGRLSSYQSRWHDSQEAIDAALAIRPGDPDALAAKARVLLWSGWPAPARDMLAKLHSENPDDVAILISLASAENAIQRPDRALNLLKQAEKIEPKNSDVKLLHDHIRATLRPELRLGWSYERDNESLNIWRYQVMDFRFNIHPRIRNFLTLDVLPTSARADVLGYPVFTPAGVLFAPRVPIEPFIPAPTVLSRAISHRICWSREASGFSSGPPSSRRAARCRSTDGFPGRRGPAPSCCCTAPPTSRQPASPPRAHASYTPPRPPSDSAPTGRSPWAPPASTGRTRLSPSARPSMLMNNRPRSRGLPMTDLELSWAPTTGKFFRDF